MAIYTGTYPGFPATYAPKTHTGGGTICQLPPRRHNYPVTRYGRRLGRLLGTAWKTDLTQANRDTWNDVAADGIYDRDGNTPAFVTGYKAFVANWWMFCWLWDKPANWTPTGYDAAQVNVEDADLDAEADTITLHFSTDPAIPDPEYVAIFVYQVSPRYAYADNPARRTRLLAAVTADELLEAPLDLTVPAQYRFRPGGPVRLYVRNKNAYRYNLPEFKNLTAPA